MSRTIDSERYGEDLRESIKTSGMSQEDYARAASSASGIKINTSFVSSAARSQAKTGKCDDGIDSRIKLEALAKFAGFTIRYKDNGNSNPADLFERNENKSAEISALLVMVADLTERVSRLEALQGTNIVPLERRA